MRAILAAPLIASPLVLHLAIVRDSRLLVIAFLGLLAALTVAAAFAHRVSPLGAIAGLVGIGALGFLEPASFARLAIGVPSAVFLALAWVFGRTLRDGRMPLVERISRAERGGDLPAALVPYTRRLTWTWMLLLGTIGILSFALALSGAKEAGSLFINVASYGLVAALFFGEYAWRRLRYPQYPHVNPLVVAANLVRRAPEVFR